MEFTFKTAQFPTNQHFSAIYDKLAGTRAPHLFHSSFIYNPLPEPPLSLLLQPKYETAAIS